jgi:hypothetical protein
MFVYQQVGENLWSVGHYKPDGKFEVDGDFGDRQLAADRVAYLNGCGMAGQSERRDFAKHIMAALVGCKGNANKLGKILAEESVMFADDLLAALNKPREPREGGAS